MGDRVFCLQDGIAYWECLLLQGVVDTTQVTKDCSDVQALVPYYYGERHWIGLERPREIQFYDIYSLRQAGRRDNLLLVRHGLTHGIATYLVIPQKEPPGAPLDGHTIGVYECETSGFTRKRITNVFRWIVDRPISSYERLFVLSSEGDGHNLKITCYNLAT